MQNGGPLLTSKVPAIPHVIECREHCKGEKDFDYLSFNILPGCDMANVGCESIMTPAMQVLPSHPRHIIVAGINRSQEVRGVYTAWLLLP